MTSSYGGKRVMNNNNNDQNNNPKSARYQLPSHSFVVDSLFGTGSSSQQQPPQPQAEQQQFACTLDALFSSTNDIATVGNAAQHHQQQQQLQSLSDQSSFSSRQQQQQQRHNYPKRNNSSISDSSVPGPRSITIQEEQELRQLPALRDRVRGYVETTIRFNIHPSESQAYLEALAKAPSVVHEETDALQFVRFCDYDLRKGGERLCRYWTERKALFGPERAFLPLTLTGTGALIEEDVTILHAGYPALLPSTTPGNRNVLLFDQRNLVPGTTAGNRQRCLFYLFRHLAQDDKSQVGEGVLTIFPLSTPKIQQGGDIQSLHQDCKSMYYCGCVFPVQLEIHLFNIPGQNRRHMVQDVVNATKRHMLQYFDQDRVHVHLKRRMNDVYEAMLALGMTKEGIPLTFGGEWLQEFMYNWCRGQDELERVKYQHLLLNEDPNQALAVAQIASSSVAVPAVAQINALSEAEAFAIQVEETKARRKMAELLHSRRKRERKREELITLQNRSKRLSVENRRLQAEQRKLENFLVQAKAIVTNLSPSSNGS